MKADAPEMRGLLALMNKYTPEFYITSMSRTAWITRTHNATASSGWDGLYDDSPALANAGPRPTPGGRCSTCRQRPYPGQLFFERDNADLSKGSTFMLSPRVLDHLWRPARMATVLVENHSLKPYRHACWAPTVLLERTLKTIARDAATFKAA